MFSPVEIRNPASSLPSSRSTSKTKASGKGQSPNSRKHKKKASVGAGGIEEVAGSTGVGVSGSLALVDRDLDAESGPITRSKAAGKKAEKVAQDDNDDDMYATEEEDDADEGRGDGTPEENVGDEEYVGEGATSSDAGLPLRKKRKPSRSDGDKGEESVHQPVEDPTTASTMAAQPDVAQGQYQQGPPPIASGILMAIDPALEALHVSNNQPNSQAPGSGACA